ncbi:hypothetical protein [Nocardioides speluncae]|uniref:hypothetical protein n=1 Tax=Nocardioides speluncae TaxID=2670337 RepID=UPI000D68D09C|nr:hypothetical protein [Nocardioides speluncae]
MFDRGEFVQVLADIEKYLGYLRGNENAYQYMREVEESMSGGEGTILDVIPWEGYGYPCPEERFKVKPALPLNIYVGPGFKREEFIASVKESMDAAWRNGEAWSAGVKDWAISVCDQFTRPSVPMLTSAMMSMQTQVVEKLAIDVNDDWAQIGANLRTNWTGEAATDFNVFYDNYDDVQHTFAIFSGYINSGVAFTTGVIDATQKGALQFVKDIRTNLEKQLEAWAKAGLKPSNPPEPLPPWITDIAKVAWDIFKLIPVGQTVDKARTVVSDVATLIKDVDAAQKKIAKDQPGKEKPIKVQTAEQIYDALSKTLYDDYLGECQKALAGLHSGGISESGAPPAPGEIADNAFTGSRILGLMKDIQDRRDWKLPEVSNESMVGPGDTY